MLEFGRDLEEFIRTNFYRNNVLDNGFLREMREIAIKKRNDSYLDDIRSKLILVNKPFTGATYINKIITIYKFNSFIGFLDSFYKYNISFKNDAFQIQLYVSILHEIMHSFQLDVFINNKSDETKYVIIRNAMSVHYGNISLSCKGKMGEELLKGYEFYDKNYSFLMDERQAELSALYFMLDIYNRFHLRDIDVLFDFHLFLILSNIREYIFKERINAPLRQFYKLINRMDLFNRLNFDKYSLRDKFIYGMPLTREELYEVCYPFINVNDSGKVFFERKNVAREKWEKKYVRK